MTYYRNSKCYGRTRMHDNLSSTSTRHKNSVGGVQNHLDPPEIFANEKKRNHLSATLKNFTK